MTKHMEVQILKDKTNNLFFFLYIHIYLNKKDVSSTFRTIYVPFIGFKYPQLLIGANPTSDCLCTKCVFLSRLLAAAPLAFRLLEALI